MGHGKVIIPQSAYDEGISADQDLRFVNKDAKLLKTMQFPSCFDESVSFVFGS